MLAGIIGTTNYTQSFFALPKTELFMLAAKSRPPFELIYILIGWRDEVLYATGVLKSKQTTWRSCSHINPEILLIYAACQSFSIFHWPYNKVASFANARAITSAALHRRFSQPPRRPRLLSKNTFNGLTATTLLLLTFILLIHLLFILLLFFFCNNASLVHSGAELQSCLRSRAWILMGNYTAFKLCKTSCVTLFFF